MDQRQRLLSPDGQERAAAAEALSLMGPGAAFAAVELVGVCGDDEDVREWAVAALEALGPPPEESIKGLAVLLSASDALVAYWAATLLGRSGITAKSTQDRLAVVLTTSKERSVKERAAWALGMIGADSKVARQALVGAADGSDPRLARLAAASLEQIQV